MIDRGDIQGRLRLFRYGLLVVVVVTFLISLLAPFSYLRFVAESGLAGPGIGDFIGQAIVYTIVVAILAVVVYAIYHYVLTRRWPFIGGDGSASS